jgi:hypothetical protein
MRTIDLSTATKTLAEYASELEDGIVVLTAANKPVAAIVSLKNVDRESLALSTNPIFMEIIQQARQEVAEGKTLSLEEVKAAANL